MLFTRCAACVGSDEWAEVGQGGQRWDLKHDPNIREDIGVRFYPSTLSISFDTIVSLIEVHPLFWWDIEDDLTETSSWETEN